MTIVKPKGHTDVASYLAQVSAPEREALRALHELMLSLLPGAEVRISYQVPTYRFEDRNVVSWGVSSSGCSLYVMSPAAAKQLAVALPKYTFSGATLHFSAAAPLPKTVVKKIVSARVAENRALTAARRK